MARSFKMNASNADITLMMDGYISDDGETVTGRIIKIEGDRVETVSIAGSVSASSGVETMIFSSISSTLNANVSSTISGAGKVVGEIDLNGGELILPAVGAANNRLTSYTTAQNVADEAGLTVLGNVPVDDPCQLARALRNAYLEIIAGQGIARTEVAGRSVYFTAGDKEALRTEMRKAEAQCAAIRDEAQAPSSVPRTRRSIRFNPYC